MSCKIDRRLTYYMMIDTETANTQRIDGKLFMKDAQVYDVGIAIVDRYGRIYVRFSIVVTDTFDYLTEAMQSAYYADKLPQYYAQLENGERVRMSLYEVRKLVCELMEEYNVRAVIAHNARFDYNALNATQRYTTKSKYRYFFPRGTEIWDTMKMAQDVFTVRPTYKRFCEQHGYMTKHKTPRPQVTAEVVYRYLTNNPDFVEAHTGLEDVEIETAIFSACMRAHKKMRRKLWED